VEITVLVHKNVLGFDKDMFQIRPSCPREHVHHLRPLVVKLAYLTVTLDNEVYGLEHQDKEPKVEEDTSIYICQGLTGPLTRSVTVP
jgi:hypothetical protein